MAEQNITVNVKLGYKNTDFTRTYGIDDVARADLELIQDKIDAINASISAGTDGGMSSFFLADDYDSTEDIGTMIGIIEAEAVIIEEELIYQRSV